MFPNDRCTLSLLHGQNTWFIRPLLSYKPNAWELCPLLVWCIHSYDYQNPKAETTFQHHEVELPLHELPTIFYINVSFSPTKKPGGNPWNSRGYPGSLHSGGQLYRQIQDLRSIYLRTLLWSEWCRTTKGTYQGDDSKNETPEKTQRQKHNTQGKKGGLEVEIDRKLWKSCHVFFLAFQGCRGFLLL